MKTPWIVAPSHFSFFTSQRDPIPIPIPIPIPTPNCTNLMPCSCPPPFFAFAGNFLIISIWKPGQKLCVVCKTVIIHKSPQNPEPEPEPKPKPETETETEAKGNQNGNGNIRMVRVKLRLSVYNYMVQLSRRKTNKWVSLAKLCSLCNFWESIRKYRSVPECSAIVYRPPAPLPTPPHRHH